MTGNRKKVRNGLYVLVGIIVVMVIGFSLILRGSSPTQAFQKQTPSSGSATETPTPEPTAEACADTWAIQESNNKDNRWFFDGIAAIRDAKTNEEAVDAAYEWQAKVRLDPDLMVGAVKTFLLKEVDRKTLSDSEGCATQDLVDLDLELGTLLASSKITPEDVPETATNTGVDPNSGVVVRQASAGISGEMDAIKVTLPDGRVVWIMARCGNLATPGNPPLLPPGDTDNPPPPVCPPEMPEGTWPVCKDRATNDPSRNGNAPTGGGPNADTGSGDYVAPDDMEQPGSGPHVNPAEPAPHVPSQPSTPSSPNPAPAPTPDPAPAPAPEPSAPAPAEDAPSDCIIPPGKTSC